MSLLFCKLDPTATIPKRQTSGSAGYDLYACNGGKVPGNGDHKLPTPISTGVAVIIPDGYVGIIKPRSSLAAKFGVDVQAGVIDSDYRGELVVMLSAISKYKFEPGERIAQLLVVPIFDLDSKEISAEDFANYTTKRGTGGFGSTGK